MSDGSIQRYTPQRSHQHVPSMRSQIAEIIFQNFPETFRPGFFPVIHGKAVRVKPVGADHFLFRQNRQMHMDPNHCFLVKIIRLLPRKVFLIHVKMEFDVIDSRFEIRGDPDGNPDCLPEICRQMQRTGQRFQGVRIDARFFPQDEIICNHRGQFAGDMCNFPQRDMFRQFGFRPDCQLIAGQGELERQLEGNSFTPCPVKSLNHAVHQRDFRGKIRRAEYFFKTGQHTVLQFRLFFHFIFLS